MDSNSVIAQAVPNVKRLAAEMDISAKRCYEILGNDNPYPKAKRLVRDIANANGDALAIESIKADFSAHCDKLINRCAARQVSTAELHKELSDVIQATLKDQPIESQVREIREALGVLSIRLNELLQLTRHGVE